MAKNKDNNFPAKYSKFLGEEWMQEADSLDADGLKKIIIDSSASISEQEQLRDADDKLKAAKELVKDMSGGYGDSIKYQMAKIKYALMCLEGKGAV